MSDDAFFDIRQTRKFNLSYLKAGLEAGTKAEAEAKHAAMQKAVFIVSINDCYIYGILC